MLKLVPRILSAGDLRGASVRSQESEVVGRVEDIMIDTAYGNIAYVVMSLGRAVGLGKRLAAVPWPALLYDQDKNEFEMNIHEDLLRKAPGFDLEHLPRSEDYVWMGDLYDYYKFPRYWDND